MVIDGPAARPGGVPNKPTETEYSYRHWTRGECADLIAGLQAGASLDTLAAAHRRTVTAIQSRLALMIPASERVGREDADGWLQARLADDTDYDWLAVMRSRGAAPREVPVVTTTTYRRRPIDGPPAGERIAEIWQSIVGVGLSPESLQRFLTRPEVDDLDRYPDETLRVAGTRLWRGTGRLLLAAWVPECAWPGGGQFDVSWHNLVQLDSDAGLQLQELIAAAVAEVGSDRLAKIMSCRLGLDGDGWRTLQATGEMFAVSRERIRQLQQKALARMRRQHRPPGATDHARLILTELLHQAAAEPLDQGQALLLVAEAAMPHTAAPLAAQVLAALIGKSPAVGKHLSAEVRTAEIVRNTARAREAARQGFIDRATARMERILDETQWPTHPGIPPARSDVAPQRRVHEEYGGCWQSTKVGRDVHYESQAELRMLHLLDRAAQVAWYCEQPVAISYLLDGRPHTYYPDLLAVLADNRCLIIEIKNLMELALDINQAKTNAARQFCHDNGWGFVISDGWRTAQYVQQRQVDSAITGVLQREIGKAGVLSWPQLKQLRATTPFTQADLAALALQQGWVLRRNPYRLCIRSITT